MKMREEKDKLKCGHPKQCRYFHPALKGGMRFRCCACDDPGGETPHMRELINKGIVERKKDE